MEVFFLNKFKTLSKLNLSSQGVRGQDALFDCLNAKTKFTIELDYLFTLI